MRCVVQLLTAGAKSACPRPVARPAGHPRHARVPARRFAATEETRILPFNSRLVPTLTPAVPHPHPKRRRLAPRRDRRRAARRVDPPRRDGGAERRHVRGGRLLRLGPRDRRGVQAHPASLGEASRGWVQRRRAHRGVHGHGQVHAPARSLGRRHRAARHQGSVRGAAQQSRARRPRAVAAQGERRRRSGDGIRRRRQLLRGVRGARSRPVRQRPERQEQRCWCWFRREKRRLVLGG